MSSVQRPSAVRQSAPQVEAAEDHVASARRGPVAPAMAGKIEDVRLWALGPPNDFAGLPPGGLPSGARLPARSVAPGC